MQITLNSELKEVQTGLTISELLLLELQNSSPKGIAVAVNNQLISKSNWETTQLKEHDQILLVRAAQGG